MKLCYPHDVPRVGIERTYRNSRVTPVVVAAISLGVGGFCAQRTLAGGPWQLWLIVGFCSLIALFTIPLAVKVYRSSNWLVRQTADGLYVKFRSYLNHHFPDDVETVAYIPHSEIEQVRRYRQRATVPDSAKKSDTDTEMWTFVELKLKHQETGALAQALARERSLTGPQKAVSTTYRDYPVRLAAPDVIRIEWGVTPGASKAVTALGRRSSAGPDTLDDLGDWRQMDDAQRDALIVELSERGKLMKARRLARDRYGYSLSEAKEFVESLTAARPESAT